MALSNTATPIYYGAFRDAVLRGDIPVNKEISMEMNRIDDLIADPRFYYDDKAVEGFIAFCEEELTLTDGEDLHLLDSFKVWAEQIFGWYYFEERSVFEPDPDGHGGHYVQKVVKKRLVNKQYLIVARGAAKSMYASCVQSGYGYHTSDHDCANYETGGRDSITDQDFYCESERAILSVLNRRITTEHHWVQGESNEIDSYKEGY